MGIFKKISESAQNSINQANTSIQKVYKNFGKVEKMRIEAYKCINSNGILSEYIGDFEVQFNPTNYKEDYTSVFEEDKIIGDVNNPHFIKAQSDKMSFTFLLDATLFDRDFNTNNELFIDEVNKTNQTQKIIETSSVFEAIKRFKSLTLNLEYGKSPNALRLMWGEFVWDGYMKSISVSHELFDTTGTPIRSKLNCVFVKHSKVDTSDEKKKSKDKDLSKIHTVKEGDTLASIAASEYGNPALYTELGRVNNINNIRSLTVGQTLELPPLNIV